MPKDHSEMRLGKAAPKLDSRTLRLAAYLRHEDLPEPPKSLYLTRKVAAAKRLMLLNDELGCCTIASALHQMQTVSANVGREFDPTDEQVLEAYRRICGYNPDDPNSDAGGVELDVLNAWRKDGIGGHQIVAFVAIDPHDLHQVRTAINIFGGIYTGFALPSSAQNQDVWTPVRGSRGAPGSWGGHAVPVLDYEMGNAYLGKPRFYCVTWGEVKAMTDSFFTKYCDEAYAIVTKDWLDDKGKNPLGLDLNGLMRDLKAVTSRRATAPSPTQSQGARKRR